MSQQFRYKILEELERGLETKPPNPLRRGSPAGWCRRICWRRRCRQSLSSRRTGCCPSSSFRRPPTAASSTRTANRKNADFRTGGTLSTHSHLPFLLPHLGREETADEEANDGDGHEDGDDDPAYGVGHAVIDADAGRVELLGPLISHGVRQVLPELWERGERKLAPQLHCYSHFPRCLTH